jgi:flagellar basal body-associated protein FliL
VTATTDNNSYVIPVTTSVITTVMVILLTLIVICFGIVEIYILWKINKRTEHAADDHYDNATQIQIPNIAYNQTQAATTKVTNEEVYYEPLHA